MSALPRLTQAIVTKAERAGKTAGWYKLCREGYTPGEIALYSETAHRNDVRSRVVEHAKGYGLPVPANCAPSRQYVRKMPEAQDPRAAFRATVMRTGLALVLTQPMMDELCAAVDGVRSDRALYFRELGNAAPNNFIATKAALAKRGLVDCSGKLTPIGERLIDLLKEAGVFKPADAALERKAGGRP